MSKHFAPKPTNRIGGLDSNESSLHRRLNLQLLFGHPERSNISPVIYWLSLLKLEASCPVRKSFERGSEKARLTVARQKTHFSAMMLNQYPVWCPSPRHLIKVDHVQLQIPNPEAPSDCRRLEMATRIPVFHSESPALPNALGRCRVSRSSPVELSSRPATASRL
jgi:hypothetical protein